MRVELVEVSPRDGLQNERAILPTADKVALVERAIAAGARRIEVASFVNPARVPQMGDAEAVIAALPRRADATFIGLALNTRGVLRALATDIDEIGLVCVASDTFGLRNQNQTSDQSVDIACDSIRLAREAGRAVQVTIAVAFGCPFEGPTDVARVVAMARRLAAAGPREIAVADTIGVARPVEVARLVRLVREAVAPLPVRVHLHDTRGMGVANGLAAIEAGAATVDAAIGGTGGCPFAPGAAGNTASEAMVYALPEAFGLDLAQLVEAAAWLDARLGRTPSSAVGRTLRAG